MSVFKNQYSRALKVIPSDNANIPFPHLISSGTNTSVSDNYLISSSADFIALNVSAGDVVYNKSENLAATVLEVVNGTTLLLNAEAFNGPSEYAIYAASPQTTIGNEGCNLYVGVTGTLVVTTASQDVVTFAGVQAGTVLPVQVVKVHSASTAMSIVALW